MPKTGTDKQGRKIRWDEEKEAWVPAETGKDKDGNSIWFDGEAWNKVETKPIAAEPVKGKPAEKAFMIGRTGLTPQYIKSLSDNAGQLQQIMGGMANTASFGAVKKFAPEALPAPQTDEEKIFRGIGDFAGFLGGPAKAGEALVKYGGKIVSRVLPRLAGAARTAAPVVRATGRVAKGGLELGTATSLSDVLDPEAQGIIEKFRQGGATGSLFATMALVNPKSKLLGQAIKQVGGRVLGQALGSYDIKDPDLTNKVFNEILYTYFLSKGYNSKQIAANRKLAEAEIKSINERGKETLGGQWSDLSIDKVVSGPGVEFGGEGVYKTGRSPVAVGGPGTPTEFAAEYAKRMAPQPVGPVSPSSPRPMAGGEFGGDEVNRLMSGPVAVSGPGVEWGSPAKPPAMPTPPKPTTPVSKIKTEVPVKPEAPKAAGKPGIELTPESYKKQNPHSGGALTGDSKAFDALQPDAEVWVFHATSPENASALISGSGVAIPQGGGIRGKSSGLYVGSDPFSVSGYGSDIVAIKVKKAQLSPSPEAKMKGSLGEAITDAGAGAIVSGKPLEIIRVGNENVSGYEALLKARTTVSKEPWEMTLDEYGRKEYSKKNEQLIQERSDIRSGKQPVGPFHRYKTKAEGVREINSELAKDFPPTSTLWNPKRYGDHYQEVSRALREGKSVPPEVLADYPDLAKAPSKPLDLTRDQMKMGIDEFDKQWLKDESGVGIVEKGDKWLNKLNKYLVESGTISSTPDKIVGYQIQETKDAVKKAEPIGEKLREKRFLYGVTTEKNMARMGESGKAIATAADNYARTKRSETLKDNTSVIKANVAAREIYPSISSTGKEFDTAVHKRVAELIEKRGVPKSAAEANLVKQFDAPFQKVRDRVAALQKSGVKVTIDGPYGPREWSPVDGYYPRVYENLSELLSSDLPNGKHAKQILTERIAKRDFKDLYNDPATKKDAIEKAGRVVDIRLGQMRKGKYGHLEKSRLWEDSDLAELEAKGLVKRVYGTSVLADYFTKVNDRLAWLENFGHDVQQYVNGGTQTLPKLLADKLPDIKDADNRQYLANFFRDYMNRGQMTSRTRIAYDLMGKFQNLKLWMAGIPNSSQWLVNTLPKTPTQDWGKTIYETIKSYGGKKYGLDFLNESGIQMLANDINRMNFDSPEKLKAFNDLFFKLTGFKWTENWNARFAAFAGKNTAQRFANRMSSRPESFRAEFWESELKRMGVEQSTIDTIKKGGSSKLSMQELAKAGWAMKKWTQFVQEEFFLPATFSKEQLAPMLKFKNYPYNQTVNWLGGEIGKPAVDLWESFSKKGRAGKEGDVVPLMKAMLTIPIGGWAVTQIKKKIYNLAGLNLYKDIIDNGPWWQKMGLYILNAGNLGLVTDIMLASGGHELLTSIAGPSASDFVSVTDAVTKSSQEFKKSFDANNPQFLKDRAKAIESYWLRVGERLLPESKLIINKMFTDYKDIKDAKKWTAASSIAKERYKIAYIYNSPDVAEQIWDAYLSTQGDEYYKLFGTVPEKPTIDEIDQYYQGITEMPGKGMLKR